MRPRRGRGLFISDTQEPFGVPGAVKFCKAVQKEYGIIDDECYHVGDETDQYWAGLWDKDPDSPHTPNSEIDDALAKMHEWYAAFPKMKVAKSNHMLRWAKRAFKAGIPSQLMVPYRQMIQAPARWQWADEWVIPWKKPVKMIHGMGYGGMYAYRTAAMDQGMNIIFGHLHANAGIAHVVTASQKMWGMNVGCLIDTESYAFHYGKDFRFKPWLGVGVVLDEGTLPILIPFERF